MNDKEKSREEMDLIIDTWPRSQIVEELRVDPHFARHLLRQADHWRIQAQLYRKSHDLMMESKDRWKQLITDHE